MKRILFVFLIVFILGSCKSDFDNVNYIMTNNSSKEITFDFYNEEVVIQSVSEEPDNIKIFSINSGEGIFEPENLKPAEGQGHLKSIKMNSVNKGRAGFEFTFIDVDSFALHVVNTLPVEVTIEAGNYIENNIDDEILTNLTVAPYIEIKTAKIYTNKPEFTAKTEYPVIIDWKFSIPEESEESANGTVSVIIR